MEPIALISRIDNRVEKPARAIRELCRAGADMVIFEDLSPEGFSEEYLDCLREAYEAPIIAAGALHGLEDMKKALESGAKMVLLRDAALLDTKWIETAAAEFSPDRIAVEVDIRAMPENAYHVFYGQGKLDSGKDAYEYCKNAAAKGAGMLILRGCADPLYVRHITQAVSVPVCIALDVARIDAAGESGVSGFLIDDASAWNTRRAKDALEARGLPMRQYILAGNIADVQFKDGLIPAIAQDYATGEVLMQAYMNREALEQTLETGKATYYSRSRRKLWVKGETSGHYQYVRKLAYDCDGDSLLLQVRPLGPACHTGARSCFFGDLAVPLDGAQNVHSVLHDVFRVIEDRAQHPKEGSYTNYLLDKGVEKICKKVGEEAAESIIAAMKGDAAELQYETADLLYHLLVLLFDQGLTPEDVLQALKHRAG